MITNFLKKIIQLILRKRIERMVRHYGYRVTDFEWLPEGKERDSVCRITPTHDGFDHQGDDCPCNPIKHLETLEDDDYLLIQHREMNA